MTEIAVTVPQTAAVSVLVVVGTDHHPFDRVVRWTDAWLMTRGDGLRAVVQHGSSAPPRHAEGHVLVPHDELARLMREAEIIVSHGGPATISEIRRCGKVPIVVPRDPSAGEHVDGHQQRFARRMAGEGLVVLCEDEPALRAALTAGLEDPRSLRVDATDDQARISGAVLRVGGLVDDLIASRRGARASRLRWGGARVPAQGDAGADARGISPAA